MPTDIDDVIHSSCDLVVTVFGAVRPITRKIMTYGMASINTLRSTYFSDHYEFDLLWSKNLIGVIVSAIHNNSKHIWKSKKIILTFSQPGLANIPVIVSLWSQSQKEHLNKYPNFSFS